MSSEEEKPPAPPVRLTSNRSGVGGSETRVLLTANNIGDCPPVDMRPLPKGNFPNLLINFDSK